MVVVVVAIRTTTAKALGLIKRLEVVTAATARAQDPPDPDAATPKHPGLVARPEELVARSPEMRIRPWHADLGAGVDLLKHAPTLMPARRGPVPGLPQPAEEPQREPRALLGAPVGSH